VSIPAILSPSSRWFVGSVAALAVMVVIAALVGLVWVPVAQGEGPVTGLWDAICRGIGLPEPFRPAQQPTTPVARPSDVIVTAYMMGPTDADSIGRGATLSLRCTMCHGARGMSEADTPNLAGQHDSAVYKQLRDYKSGHRPSPIMAPLVANLSDRDMRDLAAYYAYLPRAGTAAPASALPPVPPIVQTGAPMRNVAPCGSCHGQIDTKTATPRLEGEPLVYVRRQLVAFANGLRRNDINAQMRNVARQMTAAEIEESARYYSSR
jgi:cytochrome c553